jgi:hypothetical protein
MFRYIVNTAMRPFISWWLKTSVKSWSRWPCPPDSPSAHGVGTDPARLLLTGSGIAAGFGVLTHDLGLAGQLARRLAVLSGRAIDIDVEVAADMTAVGCTQRLSTLSLDRFDAIVLVVGAVEALDLRSEHSWRRDIAVLLHTARDNSPAETEIFLVSMPKIGATTAFPPVFSGLVRHQSQRHTSIAIELAEAVPRTRVIALDRVETLRTPGTASAERWASVIAPHVSEVLRPSESVPRRLESSDEAGRQRSLEDLGILDSGPNESFDLIASIARDLLDVPMAAITFIDEDRQWMKSAIGFVGGVMPREDAFCNITIEESRHFVIEDTRADSRFSDSALVIAPNNVRFYAGYPIEGMDGHRLGALCVMDHEPRRFSPADASLLRSLALRVQDLLWEGSLR